MSKFKWIVIGLLVLIAIVAKDYRPYILVMLMMMVMFTVIPYLKMYMEQQE